MTAHAERHPAVLADCRAGEWWKGMPLEEHRAGVCAEWQRAVASGGLEGGSTKGTRKEGAA